MNWKFVVDIESHHDHIIINGIRYNNAYEIKNRIENRFADHVDINGPVSCKKLLDVINDQLHIDPYITQDDSQPPYTVLSSLIKEVTWHDFYSIVELVVPLIDDYFKSKEKELDLKKQQFKEELEFSDDIWEIDPYQYDDDIAEFRIEVVTQNAEAYKDKVNALFARKGVVWQFDETDHLKKVFPAELSERTKLIEEKLTGRFDPALYSYRKAQSFLTLSKYDPENAIKEVITVLESAGKTIFPDARTFGGVIIELKKTKQYDSKMLDLIQKFWDFTNEEPAVRHGHPILPDLLLTEAELCFHIGGALLFLLLTNHGGVFH